MRAILRRTADEESGSELKVGDLVLEIDSRSVVLEDKRLEMGPTEFKLLHFFMSHPERAYSRAQLLDQVWGANVYVEERTVDVHIRRLRKALQAGNAAYAELIQTLRGTGYRVSPRDLAVLWSRQAFSYSNHAVSFSPHSALAPCLSVLGCPGG